MAEVLKFLAEVLKKAAELLKKLAERLRLTRKADSTSFVDSAFFEVCLLIGMRRDIFCRLSLAHNVLFYLVLLYSLG